jgi:hypothetical protein
MRNLTKILGAVAFVGALAIGTAAPSMAQVYFEGPGVEFGVGPRWHHDYYYDYGRPYHHYWRHGYYDRD